LSDEHLPINIGNPEVTILEFAEKINSIIGNQAGIIYKPGDRLESDPQRRRPDITRARTILGWEPHIRVEDGLVKTIPYFRQKLGMK
jgi:dTDP-glucose 4,6-dehydratase